MAFRVICDSPSMIKFLISRSKLIFKLYIRASNSAILFETSPIYLAFLAIHSTFFCGVNGEDIHVKHFEHNSYTQYLNVGKKERVTILDNNQHYISLFKSRNRKLGNQDKFSLRKIKS